MFAPARLRGYRHLRGLDHTTLATTAHTTTQTLAAIENGQTTPSTRLITTLAQALDCPPTELHTTGDPHDNSGYWDEGSRIFRTVNPLGFPFRKRGITCRRIVGRSLLSTRTKLRRW
ncbi:MAG: helix-turn-helix domain-containing protein, partial [Pseudonocardiaceae bacterium]